MAATEDAEADEGAEADEDGAADADAVEVTDDGLAALDGDTDIWDSDDTDDEAERLSEDEAAGEGLVGGFWPRETSTNSSWLLAGVPAAGFWVTITPLAASL